MKRERYFRYFGYNTFRLIQSFVVLLVVIFVVLTDEKRLFSLPMPVYIVATLLYGFLPVKDMISSLNKTLYKGKQFSKNYLPVNNLTESQFNEMKRKYDRGALRSIIFWCGYLALFATLYYSGVITRGWLVVLAALSDFCIYFAIFFWCPFHKVLLKPKCCMDCRIFNWDSFFSFSFLLFVGSIYGYILFALGLASLVEWEIVYHRHPERFFTMSNGALKCENCDMEHCKNKGNKS